MRFKRQTSSPLEGEPELQRNSGGGYEPRLNKLAKKMRQEQTPWEQKLWKKLSHKQLGYKFRRQQAIGKYIADFYNAEKQLIIEIDGSQHVENTYDKERDNFLWSKNYKILRFWNNEIDENLEGILARIAEALELTPHRISKANSTPPQGGSFVLTIILLLSLQACTTPKPPAPVINYSSDDLNFIDQYKDASGGQYKIGQPYLINDEWHFPAQEPSYDKEGIASWYGKGMDGKQTADGEIFNSHDYTAAHPTLPMPSIVEVTNLENGRVINVRINDRGPFHSKRIIDLSKAAADALGISGTARVRVRLLQRETLEFMRYKPQYAADLNNVQPDAGDELPEEFQ